jgi:hypothetical protein
MAKKVQSNGAQRVGMKVPWDLVPSVASLPIAPILALYLYGTLLLSLLILGCVGKLEVDSPGVGKKLAALDKDKDLVVVSK